MIPKSAKSSARTSPKRAHNPLSTTHGWRDGYKAIIRNVEEYGIFLLDADGIVRTWNAGAKRSTGYLAHEIIGKHFSCFYRAEDVARGKPASELELAAAYGRVEDEGWRVRKDGSEYWANIVITAFYDKAGNVSGFLKINRDRTERRLAEDKLRQARDALAARTEELDRTNAELRSFTDFASHDLRGPLTRIEGFADAIVADPKSGLGKESRRRLERIQVNALRLRKLIDGFQDLSRAERQKLERALVDVEALAHSICDRAKESSTGGRVEFQIGALPGVKASPVLIRQVISNLVSNAIKYSGKGEHPVVEIGGRREGAVVQYFVKDNGAGFDMRDAPRLFGAFERLHSARDFPGSGLGLAIVKRIVHRHGGRVWAEGQPDQGATFWFTLADKGPDGIDGDGG